MKIYPGMNKNNTALLVIDPINSCAHEKCETPAWHIHFSKIREMLPRLDNFLINYRKKVRGLVILTTITHWTKEYLPDNLNELYTDPEVVYYSDNTTGFDEEFYAVKPEKTDLIFAKNTYDAFTIGEMVDELKKRRIKYIVIAGVFTDGCVLASTVSGFSKGYNFVILRDLVETTDSNTRQKIQKLLLQFTFPKMYGKTMTSGDLLRELS